MAQITKDITVDVARKNLFRAIIAKQNDTNSRFLRVTLCNEGEKINVPSGASAMINAERADGSSKGFLGSTNPDGTVTVPLTSWMLALDDVVKCSISIIDVDEQKLTSTSFSIEVEAAETTTDNDPTDDENYDILVRLISDCSAAKQGCETATSEAKTATSEAALATEASNTAADAANDAASRGETAATNAENAATAANSATALADTATKSANAARDEANAAATAAREAEAGAINATSEATQATNTANDASFSAYDAATSANNAAASANSAAESANAATTSANTAANSATAAAESANEATELANTATESANTATERANAAAEQAEDVAERCELAALRIYNARHYTARWNKNEERMTRLNDAAHITTDITNFAHRGSVNLNYNNPFDEIYPWSGRKLCNIDIDAYLGLTTGQSLTRAVKAWEGDTDFSYTDVNGVWVYTPEFWGKSWDEAAGATEYRYYDVVDKPCGGHVYYPERIEGRWHGRAVTLTVGGADKICLIPSVGMPAKSIALSTLHTYAKNWGATLDSIFSIDANILLMIVEFATMNTQNAIGNGVSNLYRQSSDLIQAAGTGTTVKVLKANADACIVGAIFDIGTSNGGTQVGSFEIKSTSADPTDDTLLDVTLDREVTVTAAHYWSIHGLVNTADAEIGSRSGYIGTNGRSIAYYRGEELFGNMFFYVLGAYRQTGTQHVFIAHDDNEADDADALNASLHIDTGIALSSTPGYVKQLGIMSRSGLLSCPPFCTEVGGNSVSPVGDYHYIAPSYGNTVLILGGIAGSGANDGAFCAYWRCTASHLNWDSAARPRLKNP